jgi:hypothetical protein
MLDLQEMQSAIGRTTNERDRVLADMERIEQVRRRSLLTLQRQFDISPECGRRDFQRAGTVYCKTQSA